LSQKQTRKASLQLEERVAYYFEMTLIEFLGLGRELYEGTPPAEDKQETPSSLEQTLPKPSPPHQLVEENLAELAMQVATSAKRTQDELHRLRAIIEMMGDAVAIVSKDLLIEYQNHAHREMFGSHLVGKKCTDGPSCNKEITCPTHQAIESGTVQHATISYKDKTISITASPFRNASGLIAGAIDSVRDVTQSQKLLDENMAMRECLTATMEKIEDGVMLYDQEKRIIFYNEKFKEIAGASKRNLETTDTLALHTRRLGLVTNMDEIQEAMKKAFVSKSKASVKCFYNDGTPTRIYSVEPIVAQGDKFLGFMAISRIAE
jgi:PAS domain-containing protein